MTLQEQTEDDTKIAALYADFAEEDRDLAEAGMSDYAIGLAREDSTTRNQHEDVQVRSHLL